MKIKNLSVQGFRGFNNRIDPIEFQDTLTLIYGPNSYGKTSISEALEWLLYGVTSKVEGAAVNNNKTEFQGSYRNCHFPESEIPFVEATFILPDNREVVHRGDLQKDDSIKKYIDGVEVDDWTWTKDIMADPRPFVLQHALKNLLLTNPTVRYKGFTRLIGAEELDQFQEDFVSLCTKFNKPTKVRLFLESFAEFNQNLSSLDKLSSIYKVYKKKPLDIEKLYLEVWKECTRWLPTDTKESNFLLALKNAKENAIKKVFDKEIVLTGYSETDSKELNDEIIYFVSMTTEKFIKDYLELIALGTIQHIITKSQLLDLSVKFVDNDPNICPLTDLAFYDECLKNLRIHCEEMHKENCKQISLQEKSETVLGIVQNLKLRLRVFHQHCLAKSLNLVGISDQETLSKIHTLLGDENIKHFDNIQNAVVEVKEAASQLSTSHKILDQYLVQIESSITNNTENSELSKAFAESILNYIQLENSYRETINKFIPLIKEADIVLKSKLDLLADTKEISLLIKLLEMRKDLEKKIKIQTILESLADLRKQVDDYVATKLLNVVKTTLSSDVMEWYDKIKTHGDPDVHFEGFDFPQTKGGTIRARQIEVNAKSYDKRLPSAVSSLSESKLNALGLAISVANNVKGVTTFGFILIDDPVQSLDKGHSTQIIDVIRSLIVNYKKQVILLSHDRDWLNQVRKQCRTLNGYFYEITSYSQSGPKIQRNSWAVITERFEEIKALINKPDGISSSEKQRVANEFRILYNELTAEIYHAKTGETKNPDKFNGSIVRDLLIKSGLEALNVDQIDAAYTAVNAPHHKANYSEPIETLREYLKLAAFMQAYLTKLNANCKLNKLATQINP